MGACHSSRQAFAKSDIIITKNGPIQGKYFSFDGDKQVEAFLGIPYGKPPVGELRFKKPEPSDPWDQVKDCTKFGPSCPYEDLFIDKFFVGQKVLKNEDCLYLNVFAPKRKSGHDQPNGHSVLVWIHGGGYQVHTSTIYGDYGICKGLCIKDVIVVTINYRLGFFGFLSTGDDNAKGNYGLWDSTLALRWVKENIAAFGGDPNNITVFGHSAGGVSVDLLALSSHSRDLFQKMYCLAGSAYMETILSTPEAIREACLEFAQQCGYQPDEDEDLHAQNAKLVEFFRTLSVEKLEVGIVGKNDKKFTINRDRLDLCPTFDGDFFPKSLEELRKEMPKKVVLDGVTEKEGIFMLYLNKPKGSLLEAIESVIVMMLSSRKVKNIEEAKKKLMAVYLKGVDTKNKKDLNKVYIEGVLDELIMEWAHDLIGEALLAYPYWELCYEMAKGGHTVYQYMFEYINPKSYGWLKYLAPMIKASHGTELPYIFGKGIFSKFFPKQLNEMRMADMMTTFVTSFAKYGNPNGNRKPIEGELWKPVDPGRPYRHLRINLPLPCMDDNLHQGRMKIWHQVIEDDKVYH